MRIGGWSNKRVVLMAAILSLAMGIAPAFADGMLPVDGKPGDNVDDMPVPLEIPIDRIPNYRDHMREIVETLSEYAKGRNRDFIIMARGGLELFIKGQREFQLEEMKDPDGIERHRRVPLGTPMRRYVRAVNALIIDDKYCGAPLAEAAAKADADAKAKVEAKAKAKAAAEAKVKKAGVAPPADDAIRPAVNSLLAEAEAAQAKVDREKVEARRTYKDRLIATIRDQGIRLMSFEHCKTPEQVGYAMGTAARDGVLTFASVDPKSEMDRLPKGRPHNENPANVASLAQARNILVMLDSRHYPRREEWLLDLGKGNHDVIIVDGFHKGSEPLTKAEVYDLRFKRIGPRRLVLARIDLGRAHDNRHYWKKEWRVGEPPWLDAPSRRDPGAMVVRYWESDWKKLVGDYFKGLMELGYDGVVLEGLDTYEYFEKLTPLE